MKAVRVPCGERPWPGCSLGSVGTDGPPGVVHSGTQPPFPRGKTPRVGEAGSLGLDSLLPLTGVLVQLHFLSGDRAEGRPAAPVRLRGPSEDHADENQS